MQILRTMSVSRKGKNDQALSCEENGFQEFKNLHLELHNSITLIKEINIYIPDIDLYSNT